MLETIKATIDSAGNVILKEKVKLRGKRDALVILDSDKDGDDPPFELIGSLEIVGNLEQADKEIAEMFNRSIENSAKELNR